MSSLRAACPSHVITDASARSLRQSLARASVSRPPSASAACSPSRPQEPYFFSSTYSAPHVILQRLLVCCEPRMYANATCAGDRGGQSTRTVLALFLFPAARTNCKRCALEALPPDDQKEPESVGQARERLSSLPQLLIVSLSQEPTISRCSCLQFVPSLLHPPPAAQRPCFFPSHPLSSLNILDHNAMTSSRSVRTCSYPASASDRAI